MPSSRMTALLGLLAIAGYQNRHRLGELFEQATGKTSSGAATGATPAEAAGGAQQGATRGGGGFLSGLLGGGAQQAGSGGSAAQQAGAGGGLLGGLLGGGGSPAALLSGGLGELVEKFSGSGHGDVAASWVGTGANKEIDTPQLEKALGEDTIDSLTQQTGLSRDELLSRLKTVLPTAVDKLTPEGRVPSETEAARWT